MEEVPEKIIWRNTFGEGMSVIEDEEVLEQLDGLMTRTDDVENATFNTSTLVQMPEGQTMNGEVLNKIFDESKKTGIPLRHLLKKSFPKASFLTEISPGNGVPDISKRTKRK
ncbi:MAG TPA: hypothetical protein VK787_16805 [Puia sp.]|jgi:hypothetical protein|nr:hypothetical protein [Puia sp.]